MKKLDVQKYAEAFAIGAIFGGVLELYRKPDQKCFRHPDMSSLIPMFVCNIYGWTAVTITAILDLTPRVPWALKLPALLIVATLLEGNAGYLSKSYFDKKTWQYEPQFIPAFDNYTSVGTAAFFLLAICGFSFGVYEPYLSKL